MTELVFKKIFDAKKISSSKKSSTIFKILQEIQNNDKFESPNSATFSMAIDCLESKGKLFAISKKKMICDFRNVKQLKV